MPGGDGTGPLGQGSKTGRGMGGCGTGQGGPGNAGFGGGRGRRRPQNAAPMSPQSDNTVDNAAELDALKQQEAILKQRIQDLEGQA